jgi:hypothetical protein
MRTWLFGSVLENDELELPLDYPIHGFGGWGRVSGIYYPRVGSKGPVLVRFLVIKKEEVHGSILFFLLKFS